MIRHFYHAYAGGAWALPVREHAAAVAVSGLDKFPMTVGIVGPEQDRYVLRTLLPGLFPRADIDVVEADEGYEEVTLRPLQRWCQANPTGAVMYAHDKGALDDSEWNGIWRRSMTHHVVAGHLQCRNLLAEGYDTVGCHWLPDMDNRPPFYAGNFWWARAGYINRLPYLKVIERHDCENWIGLADPKAYDLLPGFPDTSLCGPYARG